MICYDKNGPVCRYCIPNEDTNNPERYCYGLPRYQCINPLESDNPIDPNEPCTCPESYRIIKIKKKREV